MSNLWSSQLEKKFIIENMQIVFIPTTWLVDVALEASLLTSSIGFKASNCIFAKACYSTWDNNKDMIITGIGHNVEYDVGYLALLMILASNEI